MIYFKYFIKILNPSTYLLIFTKKYNIKNKLFVSIQKKKFNVKRYFLFEY